MDVEVIGVGFNSAGVDGGVARAPAALRAAGIAERLGARDDGNVALAGLRPERSARSGLLAEEALVSMVGELRLAVEAAYTQGTFPLVVGGDCPVLLGALAASPGAGLLFVDGHEDAWPPSKSTTGEAADCELGLATGFTTAELPAELGDLLPLVKADDVAVLGARDQAELRASGVPSLPVLMYRDDALHQDLEGRTTEALQRMPERFWLHVDLDVLSTESLAAVDYQQPGGLSWDELASITRQALPSAMGMSVTIYNPDLDPSREGARRIVEYLGSQFQ